MKNLINIVIKYASIIMFAIIFILLIMTDTRIEYNYANTSKLDNYICFTIVLIIALIPLIVKKTKKNKVQSEIIKREKAIIGIIFILLFIFQIIMLENIYFETGWDVSQMLNTAQKYAETGILKNENYYMKYPYFDVYPNNIFLVSIFGIIIKVAMFFNCTTPNKVLIVLGIMLVDLAGIVMVKTMDNFTKRKTFKILSALLYAIFIGGSPWFLIPYSDTFSIVFPISVLYNYTKKDKKMHNYLLIGLFSYLGYLIKPTSIIILIAIIILELYKMLFIKKSQIKNVLKNSTATIVGILIVMIFNVVLSAAIDYKVSNKYSFSLYHYLMMGMNQETTGSYSEEDVLNSLKAGDYNERIGYNKEVFVERIKSLSFIEFLEFYAKKILLNYNDGTFAWGREGGFYVKRNYNTSDFASFFKSIFYNKGNMFYIFSSVMQIIWIFIIAATILGAVMKKFHNKNSVIYLALIGLTIFVLIFEARARYLYLYSTYYIILAITGVEILYEKLHKEENKNTCIMDKASI